MPRASIPLTVRFGGRRLHVLQYYSERPDKLQVFTMSWASLQVPVDKRFRILKLVKSRLMRSPRHSWHGDGLSARRMRSEEVLAHVWGRLDEGRLDLVMFNGSRQVRAIALVAMAVLVVLVVGNRALLAEPRLVNAKNAPEVRALLAEFRENYVRLKDAYSNVYLEAVCHGFSRNSIKEPEPSDSVSRLAYRAREGAFFRTDLTMFPSGLASPPARTSVALVTPEGFLLASRESPEAKFVVAKWGENREYGLSMIGNSILAWAPFSVWIVPLDEYFLTEGSSRFQVAEVTQEKEGRDRIVAMTIQRGEAKGSLMVRVVFFRDRSWAVKEYAWGQLHADRPEALVRRAR